ncbi:hypothetical protein GO011_14630 [Mycobacterium sp. 20091114027_K0903767]|nr:hypothetical protein [Mycobacterium sp. 20091114027_K0903767]
MNPTAPTATEANEPSQQIPAVGPDPTAATLLLGALMWTKTTAANNVLAYITDDDIEHPAQAAILTAVRHLAADAQNHGPQLILDELKRTGCINSLVAQYLQEAVTSGAEPFCVWQYAAATSADSLRRRIANAAYVLQELADSQPEVGITVQATGLLADIIGHHGRLEHLRRRTGATA